MNREERIAEINAEYLQGPPDSWIDNLRNDRRFSHAFERYRRRTISRMTRLFNLDKMFEVDDPGSGMRITARIDPDSSHRDFILGVRPSGHIESHYLVSVPANDLLAALKTVEQPTFRDVLSAAAVLYDEKTVEIRERMASRLGREPGTATGGGGLPPLTRGI